jgi:uncharacterized protein YdhG (YjbR/CyaY superfamily)
LVVFSGGGRAIMAPSGAVDAMKTGRAAPKTIAQYIAAFPPDVRRTLRRIRATIRKAAPAAEEVISYQMPTYKLHGNLVHFAAYPNHIGFYPAPRAIESFKKELAAYEGSKGTIKFPIDKPVPLGLITRIVKFRVKDNRERAAARRAKR